MKGTRVPFGGTCRLAYSGAKAISVSDSETFAILGKNSPYPAYHFQIVGYEKEHNRLLKHSRENKAYLPPFFLRILHSCFTPAPSATLAFYLRREAKDRLFLKKI